MKNQIIKILTLIVISSTALSMEYQNLGYKNKITGIYEFNGSKEDKIMIQFEQDAPICNYSPESFKDFSNQNLYKVFMPETTVDPKVALIDKMKITDHGVRLSMLGKSFSKRIAGNTLFITAERE